MVPVGEISSFAVHLRRLPRTNLARRALSGEYLIVEPPAIERQWTFPKSWGAIVGLWTFDGKNATYGGPQDPTTAFGIAITDLRFRGGVATTTVTLDKAEAAGRIVFGCDSETGAYFSAGIGGGESGYVLDEFIPGRGWTAIDARGASKNLTSGRSYEVSVYVYGQLVWMDVDDVEVVRAGLPHPLRGNQAGVIAWSSGEVSFTDFALLRQTPEAFVVMQFGPPYDDLYTDVIVPTCKELGFEARRADDVYSPGIILQDIVAGLVRASVVIAEITPTNSNVFYELGYAHALGKPTILLAERGNALPFDVSGYRCIFYDNTIGGKAVVQESLARHLKNILGSQLASQVASENVEEDVG